MTLSKSDASISLTNGGGLQGGSEDVGKPDLTIDNLLEEWAPRSPRLEELPDPNGPAESYLPRAPLSDGSTATSTTRSAVYRPTSKPYNLPLNPNQESMRYSLSRLLSRPRFASFLSTPLGFSQFRSFLAQHAQPHVVSQLDLWKELDVLKNLHSQSSYAAKGISTAFENEIAGEGEETDLPRQVSHELVRHLQTIASGASSGLLEGPSKHLLDSLYATQFEGYTASQVIGRNCRYLQGKSTSPAAVKAIKEAVDSGSGITQLILNYTADGRPFMNLLTMIALHDVRGDLTYFIGGQSDLTEAMTTPEGPVSLLQSRQQVFDASIEQFSEPVLAEAREAAATNEPLVIKLPQSSPFPHDDPHSLSTRQSRLSQISHSPAIGKLKTACCKLVGKKPHQLPLPAHFATPGSKQAAIQEQGKVVGPLVPPRSVLKANKAIDSIASNYSSTYDKLLVVKQSNREILFATSGFLRHVALPGTTRQDVDKSPLVHLDLLDIIVAPPSASSSSPLLSASLLGTRGASMSMRERGISPPSIMTTKEVREKVKVAIEQGTQASFECGIRYKGDQNVSIPLVGGRMYISPLNDLFGHPAACTVVFA